MKYILVGVFLMVMSSLSCNQHINKPSLYVWDKVTIFSERFTQITIRNDTDISVVNFFHRGTFFAPLPKGQKVKIDTIKVFFTRSEKDSIFLLVNDIIEHPVEPKRSCTEFIGHLELAIDYGQFKQFGEYASVCDWTKLSSKTAQLHGILKRKIKETYLGEN